MEIQTVSSTISKSNQLAVPSLLRKTLNIKAGDKVIWNIDPVSKTAKIKAAPKDWGEYLSGLGRHVWKGVDVEKFISEGREDRKLK